MGPIDGGRDAVQRVMGRLFIVLLHPLGADLPHLLKRVEHIGIQHFIPERPIEPFHKGILTRLAWLNIAQSDAVLRTPAGKGLRQKFWSIV